MKKLYISPKDLTKGVACQHVLNASKPSPVTVEEVDWISGQVIYETNRFTKKMGIVKFCQTYKIVGKNS